MRCEAGVVHDSGLLRNIDVTGGKPADGQAGQDADDDTSGYISEEEYNKEMARLLKEKDMQSQIADGYNGKLGIGIGLNEDDRTLLQGGYDRMLDKINATDQAIEDLNARREYSGKYETVKDDPKFNTNDFVNVQSDLGNVPFGSKSTATNSCCGAIAAHNMNLLLGEDSNFADIYTEFNDNSKLIMGDLAGGALGVDPDEIKDYFEERGHKVTTELATLDNMKKPGQYIYVYIWQGQDGSLGAHYIAMENTGTEIKTYNPVNIIEVNDDMTFDMIDSFSMTWSNYFTGEAGLGYLMQID